MDTNTAIDAARSLFKPIVVWVCGGNRYHRITQTYAVSYAPAQCVFIARTCRTMGTAQHGSLLRSMPEDELGLPGTSS